MRDREKDITKTKHHLQKAKPEQLSLVHSNRLQSLVGANAKLYRPSYSQMATANLQEGPEIDHLRSQIQQRTAEILAQLPEGKRRSLFKIRFGVSLQELEKMPVQQAAAILKIGLKRR